MTNNLTTTETFATILNSRLLANAPQLKASVRDLPDETKREWPDLFLGIETCDLAAACDALVEFAATIDAAKLPHLLLAEARKIRNVRMDAEREQRRTGRLTCRQACEEIERRKAAGQSYDDVLARLP